MGFLRKAMVLQKFEWYSTGPAVPGEDCHSMIFFISEQNCKSKLRMFLCGSSCIDICSPQTLLKCSGKFLCILTTKSIRASFGWGKISNLFLIILPQLPMGLHPHHLALMLTTISKRRRNAFSQRYSSSNKGSICR